MLSAPLSSGEGAPSAPSLAVISLVWCPTKACRFHPSFSPDRPHPLPSPACTISFPSFLSSSKGKRDLSPSFPAPTSRDSPQGPGLLPAGRWSNLASLLPSRRPRPSPLLNHILSRPTPSTCAAASSASVRSHQSRPVPPGPRDSALPSPAPPPGERHRRVVRC